ncbi:MAG: FAD-dependent monooxygenase [Actinomycetota bacterium]|nr:FAD-dependent monooxygenase [Actinomycetota bacterium]
MRTVVIGGSIAGLVTGLALARDGHDVTILERDAQPLPASPRDAASQWRRGGVPQVRQAHGFVCRTRSELVAGAPDVWQALLDAGAVEQNLFDSRPASLRDCEREPGDDALVFLACRRTTFEWVLRRAAERECDVRVGSRVDGLCVDEADPRRVVGLHTADGRLDADAVIDASGRAGGLSRRLAAAGLPPLETASEDCHIVYATRFYRLRPGASWGPLNRLWAAGGMFAGYGCMLFPQDDDTFSVVFSRLPHDAALADAYSPGGFSRAVASVPFVSEWVDPQQAEPVGAPVPMAGIRNTLSRLPAVTGLFAVGDAVATTNPSFGRGAALAVASGFALASALSDRAGSLDEAAARYDEWYATEVAPWYADAVSQDRTRFARWEEAAGLMSAEHVRAADVAAPAPGAVGASRPPTVSPTLVAAAGITGDDPEVWRTFVRYAGLLAPPSTMLATDISARVNAQLAAGWTPQMPAAPSHADMVAAVQG